MCDYHDVGNRLMALSVSCMGIPCIICLILPKAGLPLYKRIELCWSRQISYDLLSKCVTLKCIAGAQVHA